MAMLTSHPAPVRTSLEVGGKTRVQTTFGDGTELVEEYDAATDRLLSRKWRGRDTLNRQQHWEFEIGEAPVAAGAAAGLRASSTNPSWHTLDTPDAWEWHVRNIPYEASTYSVTLAEDDRQLVLRTTNKKFFKRWPVPTMSRLGLRLTADAVSFRHSGTTLVVRYTKPPAALDVEQQERVHRQALRQNGGLTAAGEAPECKQS